MFYKTFTLERQTIVTTGAEFGSYLALNALIDDGDSVLIANPVYPPMLLKVRTTMSLLWVDFRWKELGSGLCYWQYFCALFINIIITVSLLTGPYFQSRAMSANVVSVLEDPVVGGLCPRNLRATLETWPDTKRRPKVLIVCPTGSNPSGANIPENHRQEIYDIVCEHDLLIIEDDPYYFINVSLKNKNIYSTSLNLWFRFSTGNVWSINDQ